MSERPNHVEVTRSVIAGNALLPLLEAHYDLQPPITCQLRFVGDNDTYQVQAGEDVYILRVYRFGRPWIRGADDYRFEADYLAFLHARGLSVSYAIPRRDGEFVSSISAPEGIRYWTLFSFLKGREVYPMNWEQSYLVGQKIAEIHLVSNEFSSKYQRFHTDLDFLFDQPVANITNFLGNSHKDDVAFITRLAHQLKERILALDISGDGYGVIGGDFNDGNRYFTDDNAVSFFDFDCCGYGWRAYDLAVFFRNARLRGGAAEMGKPLLEGYQSVRSLSSSEMSAISLFVMARQIWRFGCAVSEANLNGAEWVVNGYWERMLEALRKWSEDDTNVPF